MQFSDSAVTKRTTYPALNGRRAFITGITGQDGSYLAELLLEKGYEVWGLVRRSSTFSTERIHHILQDPCENDVRLHLCYGDLADSSSIAAAVLQSRPHEVYNLAAQSHVKVSFECPDYTTDVTGSGTLRVLETLRTLQPDARFYQASSSELYGKVVETPQTEKTPFYPRSPYACAKAYSFYITRNYREAYDMFAVNGILFNHESPRRGMTFVTRKITHSVAKIANGYQETVFLGNLDAKRDWGFAGDYVEAMWRMLQHSEPEDFVIATGEATTVREFCEVAFDYAGMPLTWHGSGKNEVGKDPDGNVRVAVDEDYFRPAEVDLLLGDASYARERLGWRPTVTLPELVRMMVDGDMQKVRAASPASTAATF